jgi:hypothetical protein
LLASKHGGASGDEIAREYVFAGARRQIPPTFRGPAVGVLITNRERPTVFICDECVELCLDIIGEENKSLLTKSGDNVPTRSAKPQRRRGGHDLSAGREGTAGTLYKYAGGASVI